MYQLISQRSPGTKVHPLEDIFLAVKLAASLNEARSPTLQLTWLESLSETSYPRLTPSKDNLAFQSSLSATAARFIFW